MLDETGTDEARDLFTSAPLVRSSRLLVPETHSALARATRSRTFGPGGAARALDILRTLLTQVEALEVDADLAERAAELAIEHALRAYDAVHLASYARIETSESVLVAADGDLVDAALTIGHTVAVPGS